MIQMSSGYEDIIMQIIANAGNGKTEAILALRSAKTGDFEAANEHITNADKAITLAHNAQTSLLTKEAQDEKFELNLLTVHSQDHLMNAITFLDFSKEFLGVLKESRF